MTHNMVLVRMNGDRGRYLQATYASALRLSLFAENKTALANHGGINITESNLRYSNNRFEELHNDLYLEVDGALQEEVDLYTNSSIAIQDLVPGTFVSPSNYSYTERQVNLANVGLEFVSKVRQFLATPREDRTLSKAIPFWIEQNGWLTIRDAVNASMMLADARSKQHADTIALANDVVLAVALSLLLCVVVFVMVPSVLFVVKTKADVFQVFLHVPVQITKLLRSSAYNQLVAAKRAHDGVDDVDDAKHEDDRRCIHRPEA
jgi:hypothetical protein